MTWDEAEAVCVKELANLASIHSHQENDFIAALGFGINTKNGPESGYWIGMTRKPDGKSGFVMTWTDHSTVTFGLKSNIYPWRNGQPDNANNEEECIYMYSPYNQNGVDKASLHSRWNDYKCSNVHSGGICKKKTLETLNLA